VLFVCCDREVGEVTKDTSLVSINFDTTETKEVLHF
jgi:hypothetical protein